MGFRAAGMGEEPRHESEDDGKDCGTSHKKLPKWMLVYVMHATGLLR